MTSPAIIVTPVILAGGSGTRLWPLSRASHPKQFLALSAGADTTLFQQAVGRLAGLGGDGLLVEPPLVVANEEQRFTAIEQLGGIGFAAPRVLLEPCGRSTAPALQLAALDVTRRHGADGADGADPILIAAPADHAIKDTDAFTAAMRQAVHLAAGGSVVIFGVRPDRPETGFGYIRANEGDGLAHGLRVQAFVEKPGLADATRFVAGGSYFWNSGMFVMRSSVWQRALEKFRPDIACTSDTTFSTATTDGAFLRFDADAFAAMPSESVDRAVMEPAACAGSGFDVKMVLLDAGWSDLGAWDAVWRVERHDQDGNASHGKAFLRDSRNTLVHATRRVVGVIGLDDITVVETADAVLVAHRLKSAQVKELVGDLAQAGQAEAGTHQRVQRPWGWYESVDQGPRFQVKRILVKPGAKLSLQMHHHRAEHWVVVSGTAEVTNGTSVTMLSENQSTYIPLGQPHRLANPGKMPLEIIEVQSGSYLGEDDIVRLEDTYGRR